MTDEIPADWRQLTLGEIVCRDRGFQSGPFGNELRAAEYISPRATDVQATDVQEDGTAGPKDAEVGVPVLMPKDLVDGAASGSTAARVSAEKAEQLTKYQLHPGDLLLARRGEVGRCALMTAAETGWICGTGCVRVRLQEEADPRFLAQYLRWPPTRTWLQDHAVGQTMASLNNAILDKMPVRLPALTEQHRIVEALATAEDAIRAARTVVEQTRRVHERLLRVLFVPESGRKRPLGSITALPAGWAIRTLGELATFTNGYRFKAAEWSDTGLPIVRIQNLNGSPDFKYFAGYPKPNWLIEPGELLFAWAGQKRVSFGPRLWNGPQGVLNQHIFRIRPREGVSKTWLYGMLRLVTGQIEDKAHGFKRTLVHVRKGDVTGQPVPVPPAAEQRRIAAWLEELEARVILEETALARTAAIENGLRNDLFSGHVRCGSV